MKKPTNTSNNYIIIISQLTPLKNTPLQPEVSKNKICDEISTFQNPPCTCRILERE